MQRPDQPRLPTAYYLLKRFLRRTLKRSKVALREPGNVTGKNPGVLAVYEQECASKNYRVDHALICLELLGLPGLAVSLQEIESIDIDRLPDSIRLLLLHRLPMTSGLKKLLSRCERKKIPVILDLDDAIHDPDLYSRSAVFDHLNKVERYLHLQMAGKINETLMRATHVTASTDKLAAYIRNCRRDVSMIPNRVSQVMIDASRSSSANRSGETMVIGYLSGSDTHQRDLAGISGVILSIMEEIPETKLLLAGPVHLPGDLAAMPPERIIRCPFQPWPVYLSGFNEICINLAPLEPENPFCLAKSAVKYLEAALAGVPTIAYPAPDFRRLIRDGETGFLAQTPSDWRRILRHCLTHPDQTRKTGEIARRNVLANETVSNNTPLWKDILQPIGVI